MTTPTGFDAMGHPVPTDRKEAAYSTAKEMGITGFEEASELVGTMAQCIERDHPYEAEKAGMKFLDLTGTYRLMAVLMTEPES